jgi:tetratricopeptide (TPR) repeat protein
MQATSNQTGQNSEQSPRQKADALRKAGALAQAADGYATLWPDGEKWTGWGYAYCLRKLGRHDDAIRVARETFTLFPSFTFARDLFAWTLFDAIKLCEPGSAKLVATADELIAVCGIQDGRFESTSPYVPVVLGLAKLWHKKGRDAKALETLERLEPARLSGEERTIEIRGRPSRIASNREKYYVVKTGALEKLERWAECLASCTEAMNVCGRLHHDNDIWLARRIALSKVHMGEVSQGLAELIKLAERKPTTFLHFDIAVVAKLVDDIDLALKHLRTSLASKDDFRFKVRAVLLMADILWERGDLDLARTHLELVVAIRVENQWNIDADLNQRIERWQMIRGTTSAQELIQSLTSEWNPIQERANRLDGEVVTVLPNDRGGFIRSTTQEKLYFSVRDWMDPEMHPMRGASVSFLTRSSFDRKHNRSSTVAWDVRPTAKNKSQRRTVKPQRRASSGRDAAANV